MKASLTWAREGSGLLDISKRDGSVHEDDGGQTPRPQPISTAINYNRGRNLGVLIDSLPPEILAQIFAWCTPSSADQDGFQPQFALTLSHVSSYWRVVALNSPRIWMYAKINVFEDYLPPAIKLMELYMDRSGVCPIFIDVDFVDPWGAYKHVLGLFEQIVEAARLHRPVQALADSFVATHIEATSSEARPMREEWYFWSARAAPSTPLITGSPDTSLQLANTKTASQTIGPSVTIRALRLAIGTFVLESYLPLAPSLTFLIINDKNTFTYLSSYEALRILHAFPLLVHCSLLVNFAQVGVLLECPPVEMRFLKSLSLSWTDWMDAGPLLDKINTPVLRELELSGLLPENGRPEGWDHLATFLTRCRPPLTHIVFENIDCFYISLLECLTLLPSLEGLWLEDCILDDATIRGLYSSPLQDAGHGVLTRLDTLVLLSCYWFSFDTLVTTLKTASDNIDHDDPLKVKVYVNGCGEVSPEQLAQLRHLGITSIELGPDSLPSEMLYLQELESVP